MAEKRRTYTVTITEGGHNDCEILRLRSAARIAAPVTAGLATEAAYLIADEEPERFDEKVKSLIRIKKAGRSDDGTDDG